MSQDETAVNNEVVADSTVSESAPVETKTEVAEDVMEMSLEELTGAEEETEGKAEKPSEAKPVETEAEQPQGEEKPLAPKSENRFQKLANENRELKEQLDRLKLQETQLASEQELLNEINPETGDYYTPQEVERIAFAKSREAQQQAVSQQRYQLEVQQNQQLLATEAEKALTDFPIFDSNSPQYNAALTAQADELLKQSLIIQDGVIVGSTLSPYQLYKTISDSTQANQAQYKAEAQKATEKMLANADATGGSSQATKTKVDPMLEAFDMEAGF